MHSVWSRKHSSSLNMLTYYDKLNTTSLLNAVTRDVLNADVDAGVSELCWVDVDVTCDECRVVLWRDAESWRIVVIGVTVVDETALCTVMGLIVNSTQTVVPCNKCISGITATTQCHCWASNHRSVCRTANECGFCNCTHATKTAELSSFKNNRIFTSTKGAM